MGRRFVLNRWAKYFGVILNQSNSRNLQGRAGALRYQVGGAGPGFPVNVYAIAQYYIFFRKPAELGDFTCVEIAPVVCNLLRCEEFLFAGESAVFFSMEATAGVK